jgi:hypothetical protein
MGAFTPFLYAFREREYILGSLRAALRRTLTLSYINIGGVTVGSAAEVPGKAHEFLDYFEPKIDEYNDLLSFNHIFVKRTANVGVLERPVHQVRPLRPDDPRQRNPAGPARDRPVQHLRRLGISIVFVGSGMKGNARRLLGSILGEDAGDEAVRAHPAAVHRSRCPMGISAQDAARDGKFPGRGVCGIRKPARAPRLFIEARAADSVPRKDPRAEFRELSGDGRAVQKRPAGRCSGDRGSIDIVMGEVDR